jgi:hypothetical protein
MASSADKAFTCTINILDKYVMVLRQFNTDSFPVTSVNNLSRFWNPTTPFVTLSGAITHDPLEAYLPDHIHNQLQAEYNAELNGELHPRLSFVTQCRQHIKPQTKKSATMQTISTAKNFKYIMMKFVAAGIEAFDIDSANDLDTILEHVRNARFKMNDQEDEREEYSDLMWYFYNTRSATLDRCEVLNETLSNTFVSILCSEDVKGKYIHRKHMNKADACAMMFVRMYHKIAEHISITTQLTRKKYNSNDLLNFIYTLHTNNVIYMNKVFLNTIRNAIELTPTPSTRSGESE